MSLPTFASLPFVERLKAARRQVMWLGAAMTLLGVVALIFPVFSTLAVTVFIGSLLITFGIVSLSSALLMVGAGPFFGALLFAAASIAAGVYMLANPGLGAAALTVVVGSVFLVQGVYELVLAFEVPHAAGRLGMILSGLISLLLSFVVLAGWPASSLVVLGVVFGVNFITSGVGLLLVSRA